MLKRIMIAAAALTLIACFAVRAELPDRGSFFSEALGTEKVYRIYLPPDYDSNTEYRYPSVYLMHGYNFARNNPEKDAPLEEENHWADQEQVIQICDCLFTVPDYDALLECLTEKEVGIPEAVVEYMKTEYPESPLPLPPMIIVMPDGDSGFYTDRLDGLKQWPPLDGPEFVDGIRKGATGQYETYIVRDLVGHIDSTYRTIADRDHRGVGGFSMGGVGSMNLILGNPDIFSSVTSLSALYNITPMLTDSFSVSYMKGATPEMATIFCEDSTRGADCKINKKYLMRCDPYYRLKYFKGPDIHIYFDAGDGDFFSSKNDFESFKKFDELLAEKGMSSSPENHIIPGSELNANGMHTARYWRSRVGVIFTFHAKAFGLID